MQAGACGDSSQSRGGDAGGSLDSLYGADDPLVSLGLAGLDDTLGEAASGSAFGRDRSVAGASFDALLAGGARSLVNGANGSGAGSDGGSSNGAGAGVGASGWRAVRHDAKLFAALARHALAAAQTDSRRASGGLIAEVAFALGQVCSVAGAILQVTCCSLKCTPPTVSPANDCSRPVPRLCALLLGFGI